MSVTLATVLAKHKDVATRTIGGQAVALQTAPADRPPMFVTFNETGTVIWEALDGRRSVHDLLAHVDALYPDAPASQRHADSLEFLQALLAASVLVVVEGTGA